MLSYAALKKTDLGVSFLPLILVIPSHKHLLYDISWTGLVCLGSRHGYFV